MKERQTETVETQLLNHFYETVTTFQGRQQNARSFTFSHVEIHVIFKLVGVTFTCNKHTNKLPSVILSYC